MTLTDHLHLAATRDFIEAHASDVQPLRRAKVSDGHGGFTLSMGTPVAPIRVRKVGLNSVTGVQERTTPDGKSVIVTANVIAMPDADLEVNDVLTFDDGTFVVLALALDPPWRLRAEVYKRG